MTVDLSWKILLFLLLGISLTLILEKFRNTTGMESFNGRIIVAVSSFPVEFWLGASAPSPVPTCKVYLFVLLYWRCFGTIFYPCRCFSFIRLIFWPWILWFNSVRCIRRQSNGKCNRKWYLIDPAEEKKQGSRTRWAPRIMLCAPSRARNPMKILFHALNGNSPSAGTATVKTTVVRFSNAVSVLWLSLDWLIGVA